MDKAEAEVRALMRGTQLKYFPELDDLVFLIEKRTDIDGVMMRVMFGAPIKVYFYYDDDRVLSYKYRMGLVPVISHELAHIINPVDPEAELGRRLPAPLVQLWTELRDAGVAQCSMDTSQDAS